MKDESYKVISKEVSRQISDEDCKILAMLKRKKEAEDKKYKMKYKD